MSVFQMMCCQHRNAFYVRNGFVNRIHDSLCLLIKSHIDVSYVLQQQLSKTIKYFDKWEKSWNLGIEQAWSSTIWKFFSVIFASWKLEFSIFIHSECPNWTIERTMGKFLHFFFISHSQPWRFYNCQDSNCISFGLIVATRARR